MDRRSDRNYNRGWRFDKLSDRIDRLSDLDCDRDANYHLLERGKYDLEANVNDRAICDIDREIYGIDNRNHDIDQEICSIDK